MKGVLLLFMLLFFCPDAWCQRNENLASKAYKANDFQTCFQIASSCADLDSNNISCLLYAARASHKLGDQANAKKYFHKLEIKDSTNAEVFVQLATIYEQQKRLPRAIKYYTIVNTMLPTNAVYFRKNAILYNSFGDKAEAFRLFAIANKLNPRDALTLKGLAELCLGNDQVEMADSLIKKGLEIDSENISLSYLLARSKYKQKQYDSVTFILNGLRGQIDLDSYYNKLLGYSYLQIDSIDLAIHKLQLSLVDDPDSEKLHYYLASAFEKKNQMDGALTHYEKAVELGKSPDLDLYHRNVARIALKENDLRKALNHYKDAYKYGQDAVVLYYLATTSDNYYKDKSIAIGYYERYLKTGHMHDEFMAYALSRSRYLKEQNHFSK